jgi:hypothetical protein
MACHPDPCPPKEPDLTPRQRWIAAQRLAAGDTLRLAAVMANTKSAVLSLLLNEDPEFQGLIEDCPVIHVMPRDEWRARAEAYARDAAERAMVDGRVSTLNLCLKATGLLATAQAEAEDDPDTWMDRLTDEELAEYEALDDEAEEPAEAAREAAEAPAAGPVVPVAAAAPPVIGLPPSSSPGPETMAPAATVATDDVPFPAPAVPTPPGPAAARPVSHPSFARHTDAGLERSTPQPSFSHTDAPPHHIHRPGGLPPATAGPRPGA